MKKQVMLGLILAGSAFSPGVAGPLIKAAQTGVIERVRAALTDPLVSSEEIDEAMNWAASQNLNDKIINMLKVAQLRKKLDRELKAADSVPPAKAESKGSQGPERPEPIPVGSNAVRSAGDGAPDPRIGQLIIASSGRVARIVKMTGERVDSEWLENGVTVPETDTSIANIRFLKRISDEIYLDQAADHFFLFAENAGQLDDRANALYQWFLNSAMRVDQGPVDVEKALAAFDAFDAGQNIQRVVADYVTEVTDLLPRKVKWLLGRDLKKHPGANCYNTVLLLDNNLPSLRYVDEEEFNVFIHSRLYGDLTSKRRFSETNRPPTGAVGVKDGSHAFIFIGEDLVFDKPDDENTWRITSIKNMPYSRGNPFISYSFFEPLETLQNCLEELTEQSPGEVETYHHLEAQVQLLEYLAVEFDLAKVNDEDFPEKRVVLRAAAKQLVTDIEHHVALELGTGREIQKEETKEVKQMGVVQQNSQTSIILWATLAARLSTLKKLSILAAPAGP